jgi:hypothetical protein
VLTKDQIKAANDRKIVPVECPEWGGQVFVRNLTAAERDKVEHQYPALAKSVLQRPEIRARLAVLVTCDEAGNSIFAEDDVAWLSQKSGLVIDRLIVAASKASGWTPEDLKVIGVE